MEEAIRPEKQILNSKGRVTYDEHLRAWTHVRFKKEIVHEFPILKDRQAHFSYQVLLHRSFKELLREIKKMEKSNEAIPMLLFIRKMV